MSVARNGTVVVTARTGSSILFKTMEGKDCLHNQNKDNRNLASAAHASIGPLESTMNQASESAIYSNLPPEIFDNLADHSMLDINPRSFVPLAGINGKPEQSNQHGTSIHKTGPVHIHRANNSVNNHYACERVLQDLLEVTSNQRR